ncbi:MAG: hypothetical protein M1819_006227 [Sarea resinae]|nr:MAG: hypothetical protein M1819_006227 [Sarea resinae]
MELTTLVTFMLQTAPSVQSAHLLGSWDNFCKPYPMQKDPRKGRGHWRGCHSFENIICDGDPQLPGGRREGGLKMGGRYWYYYRLDHDVEHHNPSEPSTTACPFLPGQPVNVLDVPIEAESEERRGRSDSRVATRTMNPDDKYLAPRAVPVPKLPRLTTSPASMERKRCEVRPPPAERSIKSSPYPGSTINFSRLLSRKQSEDCMRPGSPTLHAPRGTGTASRAPHSAYAETNPLSGRRGYWGREADMEISSPMLIGRTDERPYFASWKPVSSVQSSRRTPTQDTPPLIMRQSVTSPQLTFRPPARCREPSPLRQDRSAGSSMALISLQDVAKTPDDGDDFDSRASLDGLQEEAPCQHGLAPRPYQHQREASPTHDILNKELPDIPFEPLLSLMPEPLSIPTKSSQPEAPLPYTSRLHSHHAASSPPPSLDYVAPPLPAEPASSSPPIRSHFSVYSTSTFASPPRSCPPFHPTSPSFSSTTEDSNSPGCRFGYTSDQTTPSMSDFSEDDKTPERESSLEVPEPLSAPNDNVSCIDDGGPISSLAGLRIDKAGEKRKAACFGFGHFKGYTLPEEEHASELTLKGGEKKSRGRTSDVSPPQIERLDIDLDGHGFMDMWPDEHEDEPRLLHQQHGHGHTTHENEPKIGLSHHHHHSYTDTQYPDQRSSTLQQLFDELGYLGGIIAHE